MNVQVILTCFNRCEKTSQCVLSLIKGNSAIKFKFIIVDDMSTDDTCKQLKKINDKYNNIDIIKGNGNLFYSRGMRKGMIWLNDKGIVSDYVLLINDDVHFFDLAIERLIEQSKVKSDAVIIGVTCDNDGNLTYGGVRYKKNSIKYETFGCDKSNERCNTFNANCVLIPWDIYKKCKPMDGHYSHSAGDFDYGFDLYRHGAIMYTSNSYVGICDRNALEGTWMDKNLSRRERIKKKESPKGIPFRDWFYFLHKNFGLSKALIHCLTPYIRIIIGK